MGTTTTTRREQLAEVSKLPVNKLEYIGKGPFGLGEVFTSGDRTYYAMNPTEINDVIRRFENLGNNTHPNGTAYDGAVWAIND